MSVREFARGARRDNKPIEGKGGARRLGMGVLPPLLPAAALLLRAILSLADRRSHDRFFFVATYGLHHAPDACSRQP